MRAYSFAPRTARKPPAVTTQIADTTMSTAAACDSPGATWFSFSIISTAKCAPAKAMLSMNSTAGAVRSHLSVARYCSTFAAKYARCTSRRLRT